MSEDKTEIYFAHRDELAREYQKRVGEENQTPAQVVGELMAGVEEPEFINYASEGEEWSPKKVSPEGQDLILFTGYIYGAKLSAEGLRLALDNAVGFRGSESLYTNKLYLVPYIYFKRPESVTGGVSEELKKHGVGGLGLIILNEGQINELKDLVKSETSK